MGKDSHAVRPLLLFLSLTLGLSISTSTNSSTHLCDELLTSCDYYLCRESVQPCGESGYFLALGYQYCKKFMLQVKPSFSPLGQNWLDTVGQCLRSSLNEISTQHSCSEVQEQAIASHLKCYWSTGFCDISFSEKLKTLGAMYQELGDPKMFQVFLTIALRCETPWRSLYKN